MFQNGWLLIFVGAIFIGLGGVCGTMGWTKVGISSQKKNILTAVTRECESNWEMIDEAIAAIIGRDGTDLGFSSRRYKSIQVDTFLTSGLFRFREDKINSIREALSNYSEAIGEFNACLDIFGRHKPGMFIKTEYIHDKGKRAGIDGRNIDSVLSEKFLHLKGTTEKVLDIFSGKSKVSKL